MVLCAEFGFFTTTPGGSLFMKRIVASLALLSALGALFFGLVPVAAYRIFHLGILLLDRKSVV